MISEESQQRAIELIATIAGKGAELSRYFMEESEAGNFTDPVTRVVLSGAMLQFTQAVTVLRAGADARFVAPETVGRIPESALPDFNLSVPEGTPNN